MTVWLVATALLLASSDVAAPPAYAPSAGRMQLAHEVVEAQGGAKTFVDAAHAAMDALAAHNSLSLGDQEMVAKLRSYARDRLAAAAPEMVKLTENIYAHDFTEAQLRDILAFYRSPTGTVLSRKLPEIAAETQVALQPVLREMQRDILLKACELASCSPEQRAKISGLAQSAASP